jgi:inactivated superfamily I helicase
MKQNPAKVEAEFRAENIAAVEMYKLKATITDQAELQQFVYTANDELTKIDAKFAVKLKEQVAKRLEEKQKLESEFDKLLKMADEAYATEVSQTLQFSATASSKTGAEETATGQKKNPCANFSSCTVM